MTLFVWTTTIELPCFAWPGLEQDLPGGQSCNQRACDVYHSSLARIIEAGQRFDKLDPRTGLRIQFDTGCKFIPIQLTGFPWRSFQIDELVSVGRYSSKDLNKKYGCSGLGVATVAISHPAPEIKFQSKRHSFAATVVLKPVSQGTSTASFVIEVIDALRVATTDVNGFETPIRRDLSAPIAHVLKDVDRQYLQSFVQPGSSEDNTGLFRIE